MGFILGILAAIGAGIILLPIVALVLVGLFSMTGLGMAIGDFINDFFSFQWLPFYHSPSEAAYETEQASGWDVGGTVAFIAWLLLLVALIACAILVEYWGFSVPSLIVGNAIPMVVFVLALWWFRTDDFRFSMLIWGSLICEGVLLIDWLASLANPGSVKGKDGKNGKNGKQAQKK